MRWNPFGRMCSMKRRMNSPGATVIVLYRPGPRAPVVLVLECDALVVGADQSARGDGHAVRVASEIGQHLLGSGERALGIDVPLGVIERLEEGLERGLVGEIRVRAEEL